MSPTPFRSIDVYGARRSRHVNESHAECRGSNIEATRVDLHRADQPVFPSTALALESIATSGRTFLSLHLQVPQFCDVGHRS
jgi:hypothetical protein